MQRPGGKVVGEIELGDGVGGGRGIEVRPLDRARDVGELSCRRSPCSMDAQHIGEKTRGLLPASGRRRRDGPSRRPAPPRLPVRGCPRNHPSRNAPDGRDSPRGWRIPAAVRKQSGVLAGSLNSRVIRCDRSLRSDTRRPCGPAATWISGNPCFPRCGMTSQIPQINWPWLSCSTSQSTPSRSTTQGTKPSSCWNCAYQIRKSRSACGRSSLGQRRAHDHAIPDPRTGVAPRSGLDRRAVAVDEDVAGRGAETAR